MCLARANPGYDQVGDGNYTISMTLQTRNNDFNPTSVLIRSTDWVDTTREGTIPRFAKRKLLRDSPKGAAYISCRPQNENVFRNPRYYIDTTEHYVAHQSNHKVQSLENTGLSHRRPRLETRLQILFLHIWYMYTLMHATGMALYKKY